MPILAFVLVTVVGGFIYGELYYQARGVTIPLIARPYIMLQLMILETPEDAPSEWQLVLFWYLLPPIFVFIVGNGVVDFVRLFFNRDARRDAWEEAVASTYRNHVIVFGAGHVGLRVVRALVDMGFDVVVIDNSPDPGVEETLDAYESARYEPGCAHRRPRVGRPIRQADRQFYEGAVGLKFVGNISPYIRRVSGGRRNHADTQSAWRGLQHDSAGCRVRLIFRWGKCRKTAN
jgi:hypothetical protein